VLLEYKKEHPEWSSGFCINIQHHNIFLLKHSNLYGYNSRNSKTPLSPISRAFSDLFRARWAKMLEIWYASSSDHFESEEKIKTWSTTNKTNPKMSLKIIGTDFGVKIGRFTSMAPEVEFSSTTYLHKTKRNISIYKKYSSMIKTCHKIILGQIMARPTPPNQISSKVLRTVTPNRLIDRLRSVYRP